MHFPSLLSFDDFTRLVINLPAGCVHIKQEKNPKPNLKRKTPLSLPNVMNM